MTTYYHDIFRKAADAIEVVINALKGTDLAGVTIYKSASMTEMTVPRIELIFDDADIEQEGATITGNYTVHCRVRLCGHSGDETRTTYTADVATLGDILFRDDFITQITGVTNFTPFSWYPKSVKEMVDGDVYITEWTADLYCKPS